MCSFSPQSALFSDVSIGQFVLSIFKFTDFSVSLVCCYNPSIELFILATEFFFQLCNFLLVLLHRVYLFADMFYICICFNSTHNCLVKHFMLIALKYLSDNFNVCINLALVSYDCLFSFSLRSSYFIRWPMIFYWSLNILGRTLYFETLVLIYVLDFNRPPLTESFEDNVMYLFIHFVSTVSSLLCGAFL